MSQLCGFDVGRADAETIKPVNQRNALRQRARRAQKDREHKNHERQQQPIRDGADYRGRETGCHAGSALWCEGPHLQLLLLASTSSITLQQDYFSSHNLTNKRSWVARNV